MWALIPSLVAIFISLRFASIDTDLRKALITGAATLTFGGLLGGELKVLLDQVVAAKRSREDAAEFVTNVLADLKDVYDQVARSRILIPANKSVKTYGEEMRGMIQARVRLRNVTRALERRAEGLNQETRTEVTDYVYAMERYLELLSLEFRDNYKELSDKQRGYEQRAEVMLKQYAHAASTDAPPPLPEFVWKSLSQLQMLADFIGEGSQYKQSFEKPLDEASELLRNEHARILRAPGAF